MLGLGMVVLGSVLLLLLLTVRHKQNIDPLFFGTVTFKHGEMYILTIELSRLLSFAELACKSMQRLVSCVCVQSSQSSRLPV